MRTAGHVYCVGIGGIGLSAVAQWLHASGNRVSGADGTFSGITEALAGSGIPVTIPEPTILPVGVDLLVYSDAVPKDHPLRQAARTRGIRAVSYAQLLGELTQAKTTVAVAGSHGKSTTTALIGLLLEASGLDPTVVVGTQVREWQKPDRGLPLGNVRLGASPVAVIEADEYREHFLHLEPSVAVVTSLDHDHVDCFPTPADYEQAFRRFLGRLRASGTTVLCARDERLRALQDAVPSTATLRTYTLAEDPRAAHVVASPPLVSSGTQEFSITVDGKSWGRFALRVPGEHMVLNAAGAMAAVLPFGVTPAQAQKTFAAFRGTWRRFEHVGTFHGAPVISDYAHHPTELRALAAAARQWYPDRRLVIAFQPHQHARARAFASPFLDALSLFDVTILADVYGVTGREEAAPISTRDWVAALKDQGRPAIYAATLDDTENEIRNTVRPHDVVLVVGAGDIDRVPRKLASV